MMDKLKRVCKRALAKFEAPKNKWTKEKLSQSLKQSYRAFQGRELNMDSPELFTEKLQWYKVNYRTEDMERAVDKYLFKGYITEKLGEGYVVPPYGAWTSVKDFARDFDKLPTSFVLKSTLQSDGKNIKIIKNKELIDKKQLFKELKSWLKVKNTLINSFCRAYHNATPRIIAEQYVEWLGEQLYDYKFFCFDGQPYCAYAAMDHFKGGVNGDDYAISFYDTSWEQMDVRYGKHVNTPIPEPPHLAEMLRICEKLSKGFPFVRVDFFDTDEQLYVAELTFYPGGGYSPYHPVDFDRKLGELFVLPDANLL